MLLTLCLVMRTSHASRRIWEPHCVVATSKVVRFTCVHTALLFTHLLVNIRLCLRTILWAEVFGVVPGDTTLARGLADTRKVLWEQEDWEKDKALVDNLLALCPPPKPRTVRTQTCTH